MASYGKYFTIPGAIAGESFAAKQYYVCKVGTTAQEVKVAGTAATDLVIGVIQNDPADGGEAEVACMGVAKAAAETGITYGDYLTTSSTGRVKTTTTDGDSLVGMALEASSAAGDIIKVVVSLGKYYLA
jgi:hypothetical protein